VRLLVLLFQMAQMATFFLHSTEHYTWQDLGIPLWYPP